MQRGDEYRQAASQGISDLASQTSAFSQAVQNGTVYSQGQGTNDSADQRRSATESISAIDRFAESNGITRRTALDLAAHMSLSGAAGPSWARLDAVVRSSLTRTGITDQNFSSVIESARNMNVDEAFQTLQSSYQTLSRQEQDSLNTTNDYSSRTTIDDVKRLENSRSVYESASEAYSTAADRAQNSFVNQGVDLGAAFTDFLLNEKGLNVTQASEILSGSPEFASQNAALREEFAQNYIADIVEPGIAEVFGRPLPPPLAPSSPDANANVSGLQAGAFRDFSDGQIAVESGIIKNSVDADGAIATQSNAATAGNLSAQARNTEARDASTAATIADNTSGSLVETPEGIRWQTNDGNVREPATVPGPASVSGAVDANGFYQAPNVIYGFTPQTVRDQPINPILMRDMSNAAASLGDGVGIRVISGGQPSSGPDRTGSHRHDDGQSVDFVLTQNGQVIRPGQNPAMYERMIERSASSYTGIGHYDWDMHVGGGSAAFWGPDTTSATADPVFRAAYERGRS